MLCLVAAAGLLVAACGSGDGDQSEAPSDSGAPVATDPVDSEAGPVDSEAGPVETSGGNEGSTVATAPAGDEFDPEATLRYVYSIGTSSFDPSKASTSFDNVALFITYDRLVHLSPTGEAEPGLATEWEFSEDGTSLTLSLREGVKFQDGSDLTADVVKENLDRNKAGTSAGELAPVSSVEVVDPLTVRLNLSGPGGALPLALSDRAGAMVSASGIADPSLDLNPVGAGMYRVVEYQKDAKIVYERWDGYWDPDAVKAKRIEFTILPDNVAAWNAIQSGAADAGLITPSQVAEAEDAGFTVATGVNLSYYMVQMNRSRPFLDDPMVRQALVMATDTEALIEGVALGKAQANTQVFPEGYWGHSDDVDDAALAYDPETAEQMLRDAGVPEGQKYTVIIPSTNVFPQIAEALKDMWADVGIELELEPVDPVQGGVMFWGQQEGDMFISVWGGRADPAQTLSLLFTEGPLPNPGGQTTPEISAAIAEATEPGTIEERTPAVQEASRLVVEQAMTIVVYNPEPQMALSDSVLGWQNWVSSKPEFRGVGLAMEN